MVPMNLMAPMNNLPVAVMNGLAAALWEADRHFDVLEEALPEWQARQDQALDGVVPTNQLAALETDRQRLRLLDQLLFRFTKLQDAVGSRLVPATLAAFAEPFENWSMIDRLNRLEKLGFIEVNQWLIWRETRNRLAHEYPDEPEIRYSAILAAVAAAKELADLYRGWRKKLGR